MYKIVLDIGARSPLHLSGQFLTLLIFPGARVGWFSAQSMHLMVIAEQPALTYFSSPALSLQDPAPPKGNPENKLGQVFLEARSEVSGVFSSF